MNKTYDIVGRRKIYYIISIAIVVITLIVSFIFGIEIAIDFKGGTMVSYSYVGDIDTDAVEKVATEVVGANVKASTGESFKDKTKYVELSFTSKEGLTSELKASLTDKLNNEFSDNSMELLSTNDVKPSVGKTFFYKCLVSILFASVLLIVYVGARFKRINGLSAGVMAIIALLHDVFVAFATFVIFRIPLDANFMAVALTILGFSINDTIVIYDRIRENKKLMPKNTTIDELVNTSINQSMTRSINTSVAAIMVMIVVSIIAFVYNVTSILSFSFPLIIGLISGVYSTICIAGPLWVDWNHFVEKKNKGKGRKKSKK